MALSDSVLRGQAPPPLHLLLALTGAVVTGRQGHLEFLLVSSELIGGGKKIALELNH